MESRRTCVATGRCRQAPVGSIVLRTLKARQGRDGQMPGGNLSCFRSDYYLNAAIQLDLPSTIKLP